MSEQPQPLQEVRAFQRQRRIVAALGNSYEVATLNAEQLLEGAKPLYQLLTAIEGEAEEGLPLPYILSREPVAVLELIAIAIGEDLETVADMDPVEFMDVSEAWWAVNHDFFVQRLLPRVRQLFQAQTTAKRRQPRLSAPTSSAASATSPRGFRALWTRLFG